MNLNTPLLAISNLHVSYSNIYGPREILQGVDLHIHRGEALALVGESGSGKSVTAQAIMGLMGPGGAITGGTIDFDGIQLHKATRKEFGAIRGCRIGMIFQDPMTSLNPTMTIGRQIAEVLVLHEGLSSSDALERSVELLHVVGIGDAKARAKAYPFQLSGGMRQRVLIAMAIACKPDLLIADEPTTALDVTVQAQILELLRGLLKENRMSLLFITHDLSIVASLCDRAAVMYQGVIVETAEVEALFAHPQHEYTKSLLQACQGIHVNA